MIEYSKVIETLQALRKSYTYDSAAYQAIDRAIDVFFDQWQTRPDTPHAVRHVIAAHQWQRESRKTGW